MLRWKTLILFLTPFGIAAQQKVDVVLTVGHTESISCLEIDPTGQWMASGGNDKMIKIWDMKTSRELRSFGNNDGTISAMRFAPKPIGERNIFTAINHNNILTVWDISTGEALQQTPAQTTCESLDFCIGGQQLVFADPDFNLIVLDPLTGKQIRKIETPGLIRFKVNPEGNKLYYLDYQGKLIGIDLLTGDEISRFALFEQFRFPVTRLDINVAGTTLLTAYDDNHIYGFNLQNGKQEFILKGHKNRLTDLRFSNDGSKIISADHNKQIIVWDAQNHVKMYQHEGGTFGASCLAMHPSEAIFLYGEFKNIHYCDLASGQVQKTFSSRVNPLIGMDYAPTGRYLATAATDLSIKIWDLAHLRIERQVRGFFPVRFSPVSSDLICMGSPQALFIYNAETGEQKGELPTENELIQNLAFSADGRYLAGGGFGGVIRIWDLESKQIVARLKGHNGGIYACSFHPDGKLLASAGMDLQIHVWDWQKESEINHFDAHETLVSDLVFAPDGKSLASCGWDKLVKIWNTSDWSLKRTISGHVNSVMDLDYTADGRFLASCAGNNSVAEADNSVRVWDSQTGELKCQFQNPGGQVTHVVCDNNAPLVYSSGNDGFVRVWDIEQCTEIVSMANTGPTDHILVTPDYFYTASREALPYISFRQGDQLYPFEQFDLRLNRPDIVAARLRKTPSNLISAYQYVHKKRLQKAGFEPGQMDTLFHLPKISITQRPAEIQIKEASVHLDLKMSDERFAIKRLLVYLNGVPVFGSNGIDFSTRKQKELEYSVEVPLMEGNNQLQFSCVNEAGTESLIETILYVRQTSGEKHDLYLVCAGVSRYQQQQFNLAYAARDAKDLSERLKRATGAYRNIHLLLLTDSMVNTACLSEIKSFISKAGLNDAVILFFAGHGVLDEQFDYYYATHDMDFSDPPRKGISYQEIEQLMAQTKAVRKLLLMDTCHSGELDKDEIQQQSKKVYEKEIKFRAAGSAITSRDPFGIGNARDLTEMLFNDSRRASGATVIGSSGGAEFAMESDEYQNGLFTWCLLQCFSDIKADLNYDRAITVSEWSKYTSNKVSELSEGMQLPSSRALNVALDFRVW